MSFLWGSAMPRIPMRLVAIGSAVCTAISIVQVSSALAQDTVYIGGDGGPSVEVNLEALNDLYGDGDGRQLLHPWEKPRYLRRSAAPALGRGFIRVPASRVPKLAAPAATPKQPAVTAATPKLLAPPAARLPEQPPAALRRGAPAALTPLPQVPTTTTTRDQERLAELAALRAEDLITAEDYAAKQAEIVGKKAPTLTPLPGKPAALTATQGLAAPLPSVRDQKRLTDLTALRDQDLISLDEYAAKRDQILGKVTPAPAMPPVSAAPPKPPVSVAPAAPPTPKPPPKKAEPAPEKTVKPAPKAEPTPKKVAEPAPEATPPAKKETRLAALPSRPTPAGTPRLRLDFGGASAGLTPAQNDRIMKLAASLKDGSSRLQVRSYAGATGEDTGSARRASLKRALAVRSRLIEGGIRSTRIDVRALGMANDSGPADRVDIFAVAR
jgi:outer membrane protein OmpA-like peptidoglycan-associated protein